MVDATVESAGKCNITKKRLRKHSLEKVEVEFLAIFCGTFFLFSYFCLLNENIP